MPENLAKIRRQILKRHGVFLDKGTRAPRTLDESPSIYHKTQLMKYIELKFNDKLENLISSGSIYAVSERLGIDPTTVSKWRKAILLAQAKLAEESFWKEFS